MGTLKHKLLIIPLLLVQLQLMARFISCKDFKGTFYFSSQGVTLAAIDLANKSNSLPLFLVRILHNKGVEGGIKLIENILTYFDTTFLLISVGAVGIAGLLFWLLSFSQRNRMIQIIELAFLVIALLSNIFLSEKIPFQIRMLLLLSAFLLISYTGFTKILPTMKRIHAIIFICVIIGITGFIQFGLPSLMTTFCFY